jgi:uncharacterized SAM-binding protein YcdF (DUF218 family)
LTGTRPPSRTHVGRKARQSNGNRRTGSRQRKQFRWAGRLVLASCIVVFGLFVWAAIARKLAPTSNTSLTRFDAIIVLGSPADTDGNPSPRLLSRVTEAVHEYERGVAPRLIFTGGVDHNRPVEAQVMARTAEALGIPRSAIFEEGEARDTIQNGCYSARIMKNHGWHSAEVVSSASHLPRTGLIFSRLPLEWRTHAAPSLEPESAVRLGAQSARETLKTVRYLVWAEWAESCTP